MKATMPRTPSVEQQRVIDDLDHNLILFASAGTGKTFSVAKHVEKIIDLGRALPEEILCLTFTIKAAKEMKDDIHTYVGEQGLGVTTKTIHGFCYQVIRETRKRTDCAFIEPTVCDEIDEADALKRCLVDLVGEEHAKKMLIFKRVQNLTAVLHMLKQRREMKNRYTQNEVDDFQETFDTFPAAEQVQLKKLATIYYGGHEHLDSDFLYFLKTSCGKWAAAYNESLQQSNLLDFDDLICQTHQLFRENSVLTYWRERFKYIIIDEMQDTSELEYHTLKPLFSGNRIMLCGDIAQTLYSWRGSKPLQVLKAYVQDYSAHMYMYSTNYRSTRILTSASFGFLQQAFPELLGNVCPAKIQIESPVEGEPIRVVQTPTLEEEAHWIYRELEQLCPDDPTKVCIMARSNTYIRSLYVALASVRKTQHPNKDLRFFTVDQDAKIFRKAIIKDILAFFCVVQNRTDVFNLNRIVEKYVSGVGVATLKTLAQYGPIGISSATFISPETYDSGDPYESLIRASQTDNLVIYDTETTGLDLTRDQIIQLSAIRLNRRGEVIDTLDLLVLPTIPIRKEAEAVHHKSMDYLRQNGGLSPTDALRKFSDFVKGAVLVGHNSIRFDAPLVSRQLRECGLPTLEIVAEYDTFAIAQQFLPSLPNYKLETLCRHYAITNEHAHDALGDITATGKVLFSLLKPLVSTKLERCAIVATYKDKFVKLYTFLRELETLMHAGKISTMAQRIIDTCALSERYREATDENAASEFLDSLPNNETTDGPGYVRQLLMDVSLSGSQMDVLIQRLKKIPIITVHQSKGCEFDTVILAGADDSNFPAFVAQKERTLDEEKRVFYVAISRAKKRLILTYAGVNEATGFPKKPSRYIAMIPQRYLHRVVELKK